MLDLIFSEFFVLNFVLNFVFLFCFFLDVVITTPLQHSVMYSIPKKYRWDLKFSDDVRIKITNSKNELYNMSINLALLHPGLQDTKLGLWKKFMVQKGKILQILHDQNHWVLATNVPKLCRDNEVFIYVSLYSSHTSKTVIKQICHIKKCEDPEIRLVTRSVQQQPRWAFTCSKLTIKTLEQGVKYDQS